MEFLKLVKEARTIRRYRQKPIPKARLMSLVDCARLSPCGANQQKLKYLVVDDPATKALVFPTIKWAGALTEWEGPAENERPVAYMIILLDKLISSAPGVDHGIAAQSIMLAARSEGIGCCMIGAFNKPVLVESLALPASVEPLLILALGEPSETVVIEDLDVDGSTAYYRDEQDVHHVPKRTLEEVLWQQ